MTGETVRKAIEEDTAKGMVPFMIIATIGTTSSGAMDRIAEIGQVAKDYPTLFIHVDGAVSVVPLTLTSRLKSRLANRFNILILLLVVVGRRCSRSSRTSIIASSRRDQPIRSLLLHEFPQMGFNCLRCQCHVGQRPKIVDCCLGCDAGLLEKQTSG